MSRDADVIIVGAGPAGAVAALLLARAGRDVLLLDRQSFPRDKPCGDCLSAATPALLHRLGLLDAVLAQPHAWLHGWRIVAPDGASFTAHFDDARALAIERRLLDDVLVRCACAAGARLLHTQATDFIRDPHGDIAGVHTRSGPLTARFVIAADGLRSRLAGRQRVVRRKPRLRKLSLTAHLAATPLHDGIGEMHVGDGLCVGLARVADTNGRCNVTTVADAARYGRSAARDPVAFITAAIASLPQLHGRIDAAALAGSCLLASGPFDRPVRRTTFAGAALTGDAAGYYDPFTGQGVHHAILGATLLADAVNNGLGNGSMQRQLARYARARARLLRGPRVVQYLVERALARPLVANAVIARIAAAPPFARAVVAVTGDLVPAHTLLAPRTLGSLLHLHGGPA